MNDLPALRVQHFQQLISERLSREDRALVLDALEESFGRGIRRLGPVCSQDNCRHQVEMSPSLLYREHGRCPQHGHLDGPFPLAIAFNPVPSMSWFGP